MAESTVDGKVALITGGAGGIGSAVARRLVGLGAKIALSDVDESRAEALAAELGGIAVPYDVRDLAAHHRAVATVEDKLGRLDIAFLNAGVVTGVAAEEPLDEAAYRRILGINLDGVVFGVDAALPAIRRAGGGTIVATASLAGLVPMPGDLYYTATKTAVVGYARALGEQLRGEGIRVHALCPGFADTAMIAPMREAFVSNGFPILSADDVADAFVAALDSEDTGLAWIVQPGMPPSPYRFRGVPAARRDDGEHVAVPGGLEPHGSSDEGRAL